MEPNDPPAGPATDRPGQKRTRRTAIAVVSLIALDAAAISYHHALQVVRLVGNTGNWAFLPPLLPDGLIALSSMALYEAARSGAPRPRWATVGVILGCLVTLALNVAAGWPFGAGGALVSALAPVVLGISLEVLGGILRRGRRGPTAASAAGECEHRPAMTLAEAVRAAAEYQTHRQLAGNFGISKTTVGRYLAEEPPAGTDFLPPGDPVPAGLNGSGSHV